MAETCSIEWAGQQKVSQPREITIHRSTNTIPKQRPFSMCPINLYEQGFAVTIRHDLIGCVSGGFGIYEFDS